MKRAGTGKRLVGWEGWTCLLGSRGQSLSRLHWIRAPLKMGQGDEVKALCGRNGRTSLDIQPIFEGAVFGCNYCRVCFGRAKEAGAPTVMGIPAGGRVYRAKR